MGASNPQRIQALEQSFQVFNRVSARLEASYQQLEDRVTQLHDSVSDNEQPTPDSLPDTPTVEAKRLRAILMALPAGVVVLDNSGHISDCNPAARKMLGEPLKGEVWTSVIRRAFAPRTDDGHEISLKDGRRVSISTCPLGDQPGQVLLLTDVTETRQLQESLGQHQRLIAMGEMAAGLAHQIRTPLATGLLFAAQLKNASLEPNKRSQIADKVVAQLGQLESLIDDMLMFSRSGYSGEEIIDVRGLLAELANTVTAVCDQRDIDVCLDCGPTPITIKANSRILHSALLNLANNAIQAMGQGGTLSLRARSGLCGTVELTVADDGPGVPEDIREKLFQPFFTTRSDGTGLGLAVVLAVAHSHGGSVRLEPPAGDGAGPSRGSTFVVQLPVAQAAHSPDTRDAVARHVAPQEVV